MIQITNKDIIKLDDDSFDRLFAIGDIHGSLTELNMVLDYLIDVEQFNTNDQLVFTGDYVDRGENSPGVIQRLIEFKKEFPTTIFLRGNHEGMFLGYLRNFEDKTDIEGGLYGFDFGRNGGYVTLDQYKTQYGEVPEEHIQFIQNTGLVVETNGYYCVHAGFFPGVPIEKQSYEDILWMRKPFLDGNYDFGKMIVHGHTIVREPKFINNRQINIDTGCYESGRLTCFNCSHMEAYITNTKEDNYIHCYTTEDLL
jgi:serine/threonine protein phosphatase 1